jgi:enamine deaminase RidA (YjgF/YER057c/UK114 family)
MGAPVKVCGRRVTVYAQTPADVASAAGRTLGGQAAQVLAQLDACLRAARVTRAALDEVVVAYPPPEAEASGPAFEAAFREWLGPVALEPTLLGEAAVLPPGVRLRLRATAVIEGPLPPPPAR